MTRSLRDLVDSPAASKAPPPATEPAPSAPAPAGTPKSRGGKRAITTHVHEPDYETLRRAAFEQRTTIEALIDEALTLLFQAKGYPKHRPENR